MRVFVTGAAGFIGSALTKELIEAGHQVVGLARNDANAQALTAVGAEVHRGDVENPESLRSGAASADAVIHLAFVHDFARFNEICEIDRKAVEAMGSAMEGTDKLLIVTSGTAIANAGSGRPATEDDPPVSSKVFPRAATEEAVAAVRARGVRTAVVRLPQVHDTEKQGLVTFAIQIAKQKGQAAYVGEGRNRWAAAPRFDTAHLYRLVLEKGRAGAVYHAVAEEGVSMRDMVETFARGMKIPAVSITPEQALDYYGWMGHLAATDMPASGEKTQRELGWNPSGPSLITDLQNMRY